MKPLIIFLALSCAAFAQNEMWNLPLAQQDTIITYTVNANRIDSLLHVTASGRRIVQAIYNAEEIAARLRLGSLSTWIAAIEVAREVAARRDDIARELARLDADNLSAADYRAQARAIRETKRQYYRVSKKGSQVQE